MDERCQQQMKTMLPFLFCVNVDVCLGWLFYFAKPFLKYEPDKKTLAKRSIHISCCSCSH